MNVYCLVPIPRKPNNSWMAAEKVLEIGIDEKLYFYVMIATLSRSTGTFIANKAHISKCTHKQWFMADTLDKYIEWMTVHLICKYLVYLDAHCMWGIQIHNVILHYYHSKTGLMFGFRMPFENGTIWKPDMSGFRIPTIIGCVSEDVNVPQWGELCKWERSYRAMTIQLPD